MKTISLPYHLKGKSDERIMAEYGFKRILWRSDSLVAGELK
jgi:hypothetical protein